MPKEFEKNAPEEPVEVVELPEEENANVATLEIGEETEEKVQDVIQEETEADEE